MPLKVLLRFESERPIKLSELKPKTLHGLLFSFFKGSPEVGQLLHSGGIKPFSISLPSHFRYPEREVKFFALLFSLLDNSLYPKISPLFLFPKGNKFKIGSAAIKLSSVKPLEINTYEGLLRKAPEKREIVIDFLTPTSFKRRNYDYPLPEPSLVFGGLLRRWNRFSPVKLPKDLYKEIGSITVSGCWIKTKKVELMEGAKFTGFTGRVFFYSTLTGEALNYLNALALFSEFSGIGRKTTMGFGAVKVLRGES